MRVLLLAYHFPPIGGAAAQRVVHLCRQLLARGDEPIVVTGSGTAVSRWAPLDPRLGAELERRVTVYRVPSNEPPPISFWPDRLEQWLRVSHPWSRWWAAGVLDIARSIRSEIDVVHAWIAPYRTAGAVRELAKELDVPLVVDLEDPWALDEMLVYPTFVHRALERLRMRNTLRVADAILMNTHEAARRVREAFPELHAKAVLAIPNGFDPDDFAAPAPRMESKRFRIVHTGTMHTDFGRNHRNASAVRRAVRGAVRGVDFLPRSPVFLVEAVAGLYDERPEIGTEVEMHFAGVLSDQDRAVLSAAPVSVQLHGFLSHRDTIALIRSADLLFLPLHNVPDGRRVGIVPQKTYEYLASGRPILAAVPAGDARELLDAGGTAHICRPDDAVAMASAIRAELERWRHGEPVARPRRDVLARYDARRLADEIVSVYHSVLDRPGPSRQAWGGTAHAPRAT